MSALPWSSRSRERSLYGAAGSRQRRPSSHRAWVPGPCCAPVPGARHPAQKRADRHCHTKSDGSSFPLVARQGAAWLPAPARFHSTSPSNGPRATPESRSALPRPVPASSTPEHGALSGIPSGHLARPDPSSPRNCDGHRASSAAVDRSAPCRRVGQRSRRSLPASVSGEPNPATRKDEVWACTHTLKVVRRSFRAAPRWRQAAPVWFP